MEEMKIEKEKLEAIIKDYDEYIQDVKLELSNVHKLYEEKEDALRKTLELKNKIRLLEQNILKPYFARIDFENSKDKNKDICYIGKIGVVDYDDKIVTVDWRAPISSLYYDSNIGDATYKVEEENINGKLLLKRQYNIENKILLSFNDVDTVSNDELLKPYLGVSADARLKNIVSTIQKEQNEIIRSNINENLIIQGVAGSGKTTVALHRIAYLVYNYKNKINNNQYMVIGPNKFFLNYISSVLPDLDVDGVKEYDLIEFANKYLNEKFKLEKGYTNISKLKTSMKFKPIIDEYLNKYYDRFIPENDLKINNFILINYKNIKQIWDEISQKEYDVFKDKIEKFIQILDKHLAHEREKNIFRMNEFYDKQLESGLELSKVRKERSNTLEHLKKGYTPILRKHFYKSLKPTITLYKEILKNIDNYKFDNKLYYEDITPLLYINYKIHGSKDYISIRHVVIDEAQDYNELTFYALKLIMKKSTFSIYGDLAQSLYPYRSLSTWEEIKENVFANDIDIKYLTKSYRTSIEIMEEANKINKHLNLKEAQAVIRHADPVTYHKINDKYLDIEYYLNILINKDSKSIAIITKDAQESKEIYEKINNKFNVTYIDENNQEYNSGICVITSKLSKGLEFDSVIITDASKEKYLKDNQLDMKLLYVAMTRAMHNLIVMYKNDLCEILK